MINRDHNEILDNIKTLDEAKQLIMHLLVSQDDIYTILNYELRTPLMVIKGYAGLTQREDLAQEHLYFLKMIIHNVERIERLINFVRDSDVFAEWRWHRKSLLEYYPPESVDLNPTLIGSIFQIQKSIDFENDIRAYNAELNKKKEITISAKEPVTANIHIDKNLPTVQFNSAILEFTMSEVIWFLTQSYINDIFVATSSDEHWVKIAFGYSTNSSLGHVLGDFQRFENVQTSHEFSGESLSLYNIWRRLKAYAGDLSLNIQDNRDSKEPSKINVTINLKRG